MIPISMGVTHEGIMSVVSDLGMEGIVVDSCEGDEERACHLIESAIKQSVNLYEYSLIDHRFKIEDRSSFMEYLLENMDEDLTSSEVDAIETYLESITLKITLKQIGERFFTR
jgi:hypothetical protein